MSRNGGCCGGGSSGNGGCCGGGSSGNGGIAGGLELQISFFSTTVTTSSDSSLVLRPLRCKMECFVVRTNLKKKRRIIYVMLMSFCVLVTFGENSMASGLRC